MKSWRKLTKGRNHSSFIPQAIYGLMIILQSRCCHSTLTRQSTFVRDYLEFETGDRFDLVLMIMCDFCALSPEQRNGLLRKFHRNLKPNGSVLLDVYSLSAFEKRKEAATYEVNQLNGFWSPNKYYGFLNTFKYNEKKVVLDKYTIIESGRTRTIYNWLQYFAPEKLEREFMETGFFIEELYSDVAGTPYNGTSNEFAVIAKKL